MYRGFTAGADWCWKCELWKYLSGIMKVESPMKWASIEISDRWLVLIFLERGPRCCNSFTSEAISLPTLSDWPLFRIPMPPFLPKHVCVSYNVFILYKNLSWMMIVDWDHSVLHLVVGLNWNINWVFLFAFTTWCTVQISMIACWSSLH